MSEISNKIGARISLLLCVYSSVIFFCLKPLWIICSGRSTCEKRRKIADVGLGIIDIVFQQRGLVQLRADFDALQLVLDGAIDGCLY